MFHINQNTHSSVINNDCNEPRELRRKGHTHEDLDGIFGNNATMLHNQLRWDDPSDIMQHTDRIMQAQLSIKVIVRRLDFVRNWKQWRDELYVTGVTGIAGKGSPHLYRFCRRKDVPVHLLLEVDSSGHAEDVLVEVREFMSSPTLSQPLQVAIPGGAGRPCTILCPLDLIPRDVITDAVKRDLAKFVELLKVHHPERQKAMDYLLQWISRSSTQGLTPPRRLSFLEAAPLDFDVPVVSPLHGPLHHAYPVKHISVNRKVAKRPRGDIPAVPDFVSYMALREGQGCMREQAQAEWNGFAILRAGGEIDDD